MPAGEGGRKGLTACCASAETTITTFTSNAKATLATTGLTLLMNISLQYY